jgi:hypothetical protein
MKILSQVRWLCAVVVLCLVVAAVGLTAYALIIQAEARSILRDVSGLKVGVSSMADVDKLIGRHKSHLANKQCEASICDYLFEIKNWWLFRMRIEPETDFRAWVTVDGATVEGIGAMVSRDTRVFPTFPSAGIVREYRQFPTMREVKWKSYDFPSPIGKPYLEVVLDTGATPEQRQHAWDLSLHCLVKPGNGCDLPCDYLPAAWRDRESELKSEGWDTGEYYPNRARCK